MRKSLKKLFKYGLIIFLLLNIITAFHAYKFTHFYEANEDQAIQEKSVLDIAKTMLFGINAYKFPNITPDSNFQKIILKTKDNIALQGWYISAIVQPIGTVVMFHGHGNRKSSLLNESKFFREQGYNTLLLDFRAHGSSGGNTCTIGYLESEDVKLAYDYVKGRGEKNIILYGVSMGAAAITKAMKDYYLKPEKIILEMPFASLLKAGEGRIKMMELPAEPLAAMVVFWGGVEHGYWAFNLKPSEYAKTITVPTLLQWGRNDPRVQQTETELIYKNLAGKKQLVIYENSGHESLCDNEHEKWTASITNFLKQ